MKTFLLYFLLFIFGHLLYSQTGTFVSNLNSGKRNTYAVVVGISNYLEKDIPALQFANRDATFFADYLQSKAGGSVPAGNIQLLTDSAATTGAVYDAIYWLRKVCSKGDLVYFYFSGHGDLENATMYKNGFLICYNSPPNNYVKLALSIDYLNDITNTLSAQVQADVVLITDACHSGKLAGSKFKGNSLVGQQLSAVQNKEVRITSCTEDQLSNESEDWGGGRGAFSYYLINGLKGLADTKNQGVVTLNAIKFYLDSALANDPVLKRDSLVQTPVLKGNGNFQLSRVDTTAEKNAQQEVKAGMMALQMAAPVAKSAAVEELPARADDYFFYLMKKQSVEALTDTLKLNELAAEQIPFAIIHKLRMDLTTDAQRNKFTELETQLQTNKDALKRFNGKLAVCFDDKGQEVIDEYLNGDEAELERRRYYNFFNSGYDVYPRMFATALKLTQPDNYLYNILEVKLHYFTGVNARLKIPTVENQAELLELALAEQKKALALEEHAAYIYNELGNIYRMKKEFVLSEKFLLKATDMAPEWVVPWSNLVGLYAVTKNFAKGMAAAQKAKERNPEFQSIYVNNGILYELNGRLLKAEEELRKSIYINSRHYLPFEHLGNVYLNTTQYAVADSFYYEADIRKRGFHFIPGVFVDAASEGVSDQLDRSCNIDSNEVGPNDVAGQFALAKIDFENGNKVGAEKRFKRVIALDKSNPLAFHWLGNLLYDQQRWEEAEIILRYAVDNYLGEASFRHYCDSIFKLLPATLSRSCITQKFTESYYGMIADHYFLGTLYEKWNHFDEAEAQYRFIIQSDEFYSGGYYKLWSMMEKMARYEEAEGVIKNYRRVDKDISNRELNAFYKRMIGLFPDDGNWYYKAGIFLYETSAAEPDVFWADKKIVQPDTHKESNVNPQSPEGTPRSDTLPGINEIVSFADEFFYPRNDGIKYLVIADSLLDADDGMHADINNKIGDLYSWQGLVERARGYYRQSLELLPGNASTRLKLIDICDAAYHFQDAWVQLDSLVARKEINFPKQLLLAKYNVHDGYFRQADSLLKAAGNIHPYPVPEIIDLNGRLQLLAQHPKEALAYYLQYVTVKKEYATADFTVARIYAKLGNTTAAWKWLDAALKKGFSYSYVLQLDPYLQGLRKSEKWNALLKQYAFKKYPPPAGNAKF